MRFSVIQLYFVMLRAQPGPPQLALPLFVAGVALANNHDAAVAANHFAVIADRLNAGLNLHGGSSNCRCHRTYEVPQAVTSQQTYL